MTTLTFVIPVRHQDNAKDWSTLKANLAQTTASIAAQTERDWRGVVVCNHGADLPQLPAGFEVVRVDFAPNPAHERGDHSLNTFHDAFRVDKGKRVLAGMLAAPQSAYFMIVDDDDFVSNRLAAFVKANRGAAGWKLNEGYVWADRGKWLFRLSNFNKACGTSLIVARECYELPQKFDDATLRYVMDYLGSHVRIGEILAQLGCPLAPLPFRGAVYRVGHAGAHSKSRGLFRYYLFSPWVLRRPARIAKHALRFRWLTSDLRREFFAEA